MKNEKENGQIATSRNFKHYRMNTHKNPRDLTSSMISFIKHMKSQCMMKISLVSQSRMSKRSLFMKNRN